jgi:hypothetical protein
MTTLRKDAVVIAHCASRSPRYTRDLEAALDRAMAAGPRPCA